MPQHAPPFVVLMDEIDQLEEELGAQNHQEAVAIVRRLQATLPRHDLQARIARSIEKNGLSDYTIRLMRDYGYRVERLP